jgi:hypothetical protein
MCYVLGLLLRATVWQAEILISRDVLIRPRVRCASKRDSGVASEVSATVPATLLVAADEVVTDRLWSIGDIGAILETWELRQQQAA